MITLNSNQSTHDRPSWDHAYMTQEQVADYLQVSERKVSDMTNKGEIPAVKLGTGKNSAIRYRKSAVDEALSRMLIG